ncbi:MAG: Smr/MutS family protein [Deltaproteobacteria bacterium]|jgi:DNA-nicking Smr family endonuclease|nr:Smr/MutS family protein [Deltaproteobacteria bacterium]
MPKRKRQQIALPSESSQTEDYQFENSSYNPQDSPFAALAPLKASMLNARLQQPKKKANKKKSKKESKNESRPPEAADEPVQTISDEELFLREMRNVSPLPERQKIYELQPPDASSWKLPVDETEDMMAMRDLTDLVSGRGEFDFSQTDECIEAHVRGFPPGLMNQLKQGRFPIQDHLDLHGMTLLEAENAINEFIAKSVSLGRSCLLLIHGRGHRSPNGIPVIKHNLETLLLKRPVKKYLLAFTTARPIDGGSGASYILLRK